MNPQNPFEQIHQTDGRQAPTAQTPESSAGQSQPKLHNPLAVMQPGEQIICEIRRHPIGMFGIFIGSGLLLVILALFIFVLGLGVFTTPGGQITAIAGLAYFLVAALILALVFVANRVYWGNHWVVTSDSITQVTQTNLFHKQSSQLSLENLENVAAEQNGILTHIFNFGILKAETAGEHSKFIFRYCPNPNYYAQKILAAREAFEKSQHKDLRSLYQPQGALPQQPEQHAPQPSQPPQPQTQNEQSFEQVAQQHQFGPPSNPTNQSPTFPGQQPPPGPGPDAS